MQSLKDTSNPNMHLTGYFMCKFTYGLIIVNQLGRNPFISKSGKPLFIRECTNNNCNGVHSLTNIKTHMNNYEFNHTNKAKYDWVQLYLAIIKCLKNNKLESNIERLNFIELVQLWKSLDSTTDKLPEDMEKFALAFERITHLCPDQIKVNSAIMNRTKIDISDLCLGTGVNCKYGVNKTNELLCTQDFLTGNCSCIKDSNERMIHYTDSRMVPFEVQYKMYLETKETESRLLSDKNKTIDMLIKETKNNRPVVSLGRLGKKVF